MVGRSKKCRRGRQGQSLVEFAFAFPFLLLCVIAIIYFGKAFHTAQMLSFAAQEGARAAARTTGLNDPGVRDGIRGFASGGQAINPDSVIYATLGSAHLLSNGTTGNLPPGAVVKVLPWDGDGSPEDSVPPGTVSVRIDYPFSLLLNPFTGGASGEVSSVAIALSLDSGAQPVAFPDFRLSEKATVSQEVYQEVN